MSVESIKGYFEYARKELHIKNENELTKIFLELSKSVHPIVIGNVFRSRSQIMMIAEKLLSKHFEEKEKIKNIISFCVPKVGVMITPSINVRQVTFRVKHRNPHS